MFATQRRCPFFACANEKEKMYKPNSLVVRGDEWRPLCLWRTERKFVVCQPHALYNILYNYALSHHLTDIT